LELEALSDTLGDELEFLYKRLRSGRGVRTDVKEESSDVSDSVVDTFVALRIDELGQLNRAREIRLVGVVVGGKGEIDDIGSEVAIGVVDLTMKDLLYDPLKGRLI
jgi:hypothetical protein